MTDQTNESEAIRDRATRFLDAFRSEVNAHSDGWAYWKQPVKAAYHLTLIVEGDYPATEQQLTRALGKIKAFYTRHGKAAGMAYPEVL